MYNAMLLQSWLLGDVALPMQLMATKYAIRAAIGRPWYEAAR